MGSLRILNAVSKIFNLLPVRLNVFAPVMRKMAQPKFCLTTMTNFKSPNMGQRFGFLKHQLYTTLAFNKMINCILVLDHRSDIASSYGHRILN